MIDGITCWSCGTKRAESLQTCPGCGNTGGERSNEAPGHYKVDSSSAPTINTAAVSEKATCNCGFKKPIAMQKCPSCGNSGGVPSSKNYSEYLRNSSSRFSSGSSVFASLFWINGLRIFAWIFCGIGVSVGTFGALWLDPLFDSNVASNIASFFVWAGSIVVTFITTAVMMVFLGMAQNIADTNYCIRYIQKDTEEMRKKLDKMNPAA